MTEYALYVESGPRRRKTMVHVLELLGCTAQGLTTEAALEATPDAIRAYLRYLRRHDEPVDPDDAINTSIAAHVMEGGWLGNGNPTPGFPPDFQPLAAEDLRTYLRWASWLQAGLLELIRDLPPERLAAEPATGGRSISHILEHIAESDAVYVRYLVGKMDGLSEALLDVQGGPEGLPAALKEVWRILDDRLGLLTAAEREQHVPHGQVTWTARRALRRLLEHEWEHLGEIAVRLGGPAA